MTETKPPESSQVEKSSADRSQSGLVLPEPEKVTIAWLARNVPYKFWIWLILLVVGAFSAGVKVGQIEWVGDLLGENSRKPPVPDNSDRTRTSQPGTRSTDGRDEAAKLFGYDNLDALMKGFGIPPKVKERVFSCREEEAFCLSVREDRAKQDFYFNNATKCSQDGKQANGTSGIPAGFAGMVRGFSIRPCG